MNTLKTKFKITSELIKSSVSFGVNLLTSLFKIAIVGFDPLNFKPSKLEFS